MFLVKRVRFKNFRSYGNQFTEVDLMRSANTVIIGPNGNGKCLDRLTEIRVQVDSPDIQQKFLDFINEREDEGSGDS